MQTKTIVALIFWVLLAAFIIPGFVFGFQKLIAQPNKVESFKRWGYSVLFMRLLGLGEIAALISLMFPVSRYAGIAFFCIILPSAAYTHIRYNDPRKDVMTPVYVGIHLLVIFALNFFIE